MHKKIILLFMIVIAGLLWAGCGDQAVVTINGQEYDNADLERAIGLRKLVAGDEAVPAADAPQYPEFEKQMVKTIAMNHILKEEAAKMGITVSDADVDKVLREVYNQKGGEENVRQRLDESGASLDDLKDSLRTDLIFQAVFTDVTSKAPQVTDEDARAYYDAHRNEADFLKPETRNIHMIFVPTEALASQAMARLSAGEDFAAVAREMSTDQNTKDKGGERLAVPVVSSGLPTEAEKAMGQLAVGQVSDPVKSGFGYYIIRLDSINPREQVSFEEVREQLRQQLQMTGQNREFFDTWLTSAVAGYEIVYSDKYRPDTTTTP